jgi:apolipoprotein N-acyltransferase
MIWLTGLSAGLFYLSFPNVFAPRGIPFLAWGFLLPLLWALEKRTFISSVGVGLVWGMLAYGLLFRWLFPVSIAGYALFVTALALQGMILGGLLYLFPSNDRSRRDLLYLVYVPSVWVLSEYVRSFLLDGFTWALGYALATEPSLIQSASWGGVYAVGWIMIFVNTALFLAVKEKNWHGRFKHIMFAFVLLVLNYGVGLKSITTPVAEEKNSWRVAMLQPNITRTEKADVARYDENAARHITLIEESPAFDSVDLVIWPETAFPDDILTDDVWRPRLEGLARRHGVDMLIGSALLRGGYDINAAVLLTGQGIWKDSYEKQHLVPFSEAAVSIPWLGHKARRLGLQGYHFLAGTNPPVILLRRSDPRGNGGIEKNVVMGVAICSEEAYPSLFREIARKGGAFAVVMLNDGWFEAPEALRLHAHTGILRAVETGLPVLRTANTGWTVGFDGHGEEIEAVVGEDLLLQRAGVMVIDVPNKTPGSFYNRFGDIFAFTCMGFVIIIVSFCSWAQRKKKAHV